MRTEGDVEEIHKCDDVVEFDTAYSCHTNNSDCKDSIIPNNVHTWQECALGCNHSKVKDCKKWTWGSTNFTCFLKSGVAEVKKEIHQVSGIRCDTGD